MEQILEYLGVATGILYLVLEIRQHRAMWIVGFLTSLAYVFVFFRAKIYADMALNLYYVGISVYGFAQWSLHRSRAVKSPVNNTVDNPVDKAADGTADILYKHVSFRQFTTLSTVTLLLYAFTYYLLTHYTDSPIPAGDSFTTVTGIIATWMLARRIIEHWIFWVVVNLVSIYLYYLRGLYPTMLLYLCYASLAVVGYLTWKKKGTEQDDTTL